MADKVVILGGGVAGLSAAHELCERGFTVEVYESKPVFGGKARSIPVPGTGIGGRPDLPGEHGFRFFPGFYTHLPNTLGRIPSAARGNVLEHLVVAHEYLTASAKDENLVVAAREPKTIADWIALVRLFLRLPKLGIGVGELAYFVSRLLVLLTTSDERRLAEYERISWWDFIGAAERSPAYQLYLGVGLTRTLVALRAQEASTRTVGSIFIQLLLDLWSTRNELDRLLDGPTSEVWIDPWVTYLRERGVRLEAQATFVGLELDGAKVRAARVTRPDGREERLTAEHFIVAVPVERLVPLVDEALGRAEPRLLELKKLEVAWMNGLQLFLRTDASLVRGHGNLVSSPSALTFISQAQFWRRPLRDYGEGTANGVVSIDISDWETPGLGGTPLKELTTRAAIKDEVLQQMRAILRPDLAQALADDNIAAWFLDPGIELPNDSPATNLEPLLINTTGSWQHRPEATTKLPNLYLAADYVRTFTDLATMEAANEAARRAVNGILDATASAAARCQLWPLVEPGFFAWTRRYDRWRFERGLPHLWLGRETPRLLVRPKRARCAHKVEDVAQKRIRKT